MYEIHPQAKIYTLKTGHVWTLGHQIVCFVLLMFTGYDKLKAFGFPIHGGIDGYSRKILWLKVTRSNNLPSVPAQYYVDCIKEGDGCPILLHTDCGTENGIMAAAQCFFHQEGGDPYAGDRAHRYGSSPKNQRIENW